MRKNKYNAVRVEVDGIRFDSKREASRYHELRYRQMAGEITHLEVHPVWDLIVNGAKIGKYTADFVYVENGEAVVEDAKGVKTRDYVLRKKLMKAIYDIDIAEI